MLDETDYTAVLETLIISTGSQRLCVNVPIINDIIVESHETFSVILRLSSTTDESVNINISMAEITIINDDSKLRCFKVD